MKLVEEALRMETEEKQQVEDPAKQAVVVVGGALATRRLLRDVAAARLLAHRIATPPTEFIHVRKPGIVRDEAYYGKVGRAKLTPARLAAIREQERRSKP